MNQRQVEAVRNPNDGEPLAVTDAQAAANQREIIQALQAMNKLVPSNYEQILFEYSGDDMTTIVFRADGKTISTIEMVYQDHKLMSVTASK